MNRMQPLVLTEPPASARAVKLPSGRVLPKRQPSKPKLSQQSGWPGFFDDALKHILRAVVWIAFAAALLLVGYAAAIFLQAPLPEAIRPTSDMKANILGGALFFGLEVVAIVLGARQLHEDLSARLARRQLDSLNTTLERISQDIDAAANAFIDKLYDSYQPDGQFKTNLNFLNWRLVELRAGFIEETYCDLQLTNPAMIMLQRALRTLDLYCEDSYELGMRAAEFDREKAFDKAEWCLSQMLERTQTSDLMTLMGTIEQVRRKV